MSDRAVVPRRGAAERAAAWVVMGPLGHLYSTLVDLAVLLARSLAAKVLRGLRRG